MNGTKMTLIKRINADLILNRASGVRVAKPRHGTNDYNIKANEGVWESTTGVSDDEAISIFLCRVYIRQLYVRKIELQSESPPKAGELGLIQFEHKVTYVILAVPYPDELIRRRRTHKKSDDQ